MNLDKTFCRNETCPLKDKCDRSYDRVVEYMEERPVEYVRPISVSHYEPENPESCQHLIEMDEKLK